MIKARRKLEPATMKAAKRPKQGNGNAPFITRAEARQRAERYVLNRMFKGATVRDGVKAGCITYNVRREDTWVVYKNENGPPKFKSSEVVVVCKRTGRVLYEGSAHDEG